jgi:hypothetical protein
MLNAMIDVALMKDEPADLVNVVIEKLIQQNFEWSAFNELETEPTLEISYSTRGIRRYRLLPRVGPVHCVI